jgi:hypothetical protein
MVGDYETYPNGEPSFYFLIRPGILNFLSISGRTFELSAAISVCGPYF